MADFIFQSGTTTKGNIIQQIKTLMVGAGWQDISSNPATDFIVMYSKGETGDKDLVFQIREGNTTNVNPINTTNFSMASFRPCASYVPGAPGVAGTFGRTTGTEAWKYFGVSGYVYSHNLIPPNTPVTYYYHANKNRLIITLEYATFFHGFQYIGLPDIQYANEPQSRGLVQMGFGNTVGQVIVSDTPGELGSSAASVNRTLYYQVAPKNPNTAGKYHLTESFIGDTNEGYRFMLPGVYLLPSSGLVHGDTFNIGGKRYRVTYIDPASWGALSFGAANSIAYRIE